MKIEWSEELSKEVVSCAEMKEIERLADAAGLSYYEMMENAGTNAAELILKRETETLAAASVAASDTALAAGGAPQDNPAAILLFCGKGNNGGDGYVAARRLTQAGVRAAVILADGDPRTPDAAANAKLLRDLPVPILQPDSEAAQRAVSQAVVLVDAIYGTGFHGELSDSAARCAAMINNKKSRAHIYALDIPSGLSGDSAAISTGAVLADCTIVFHRKKPVHTVPSALKFCGDIVLAGIGID